MVGTCSLGFHATGTQTHSLCACMHAKLLQSRPTLCDPMDHSPPGFFVHGFSRQEYYSGLPFPPPGALPDPGIELMTPAAPVLAGRFFTTEPCGRPLYSESEGWHF